MASGSQNMTTYLAKGLEKLITTNASNTDNLLYINTADTNITADMLGATTSIAFTRASITGAYTTGHMVWLNAADIGTPFQLVVHDSSDLYLYKRWKSSGAWTVWSKMKAGTADTWTTARTITVGGTGKSVDGSANVSWSMNEIMGSSDSSKFYRGDKSWNNTLTGPLYIGTNTNRFTVHPNGLCYKGTSYDFCILRVIDGGSDWGHRLVIGAAGGLGESGNGGQQVVIGAGESAGSYVDAVSTNDESLHLLADGTIFLQAGADTIANRKGFAITSASEIIPVQADTYKNGVGTLGTNGYRWGNVYTDYLNSTNYIYAGSYVQAKKHMYMDEGHFYMKYNNTWYDILHNHVNGNISVNAAGTGLYVGYYNTTLVNWMSGRMQLKDGCLSIFPNSSNYREGIRIHSVGSWSDITLCGNDNTGDSGISANSWFIGNNNGNFYIARNGSPGSTAWLECVNNIWSTMNPLWIKGGSTEAGGNVNRLTTSSGMPGNMQYNTSRRGTQIYSNGIAFADPYNGNSNNDAGWIRHQETSVNAGELEIAVGDDGNETIVVRQYNTSNNVARRMYLLNSEGFTSVSNQSTDSSYAHAAMQIREANYAGTSSDTWGVAPRLAWHWSGRVAAQIGLASSGWLYEAPSTGTNFYKIVCETGTWGINITGSAGSVAWGNVTGKPATATRWPTWSEIGNGADGLSEATASWTDNTEILTSYASNNGFADTNAKGKVYRRDAVCAYNYIKGKAEGTWSINVTGSAGSVAWGNVSSKPATATRWPTWSEVTSKPSVQNNLTSTSTTDMLSAAQGKALNDNKTNKNTGLAYTTLLSQTYAGTSPKSISVSNISSYNALFFACYYLKWWRGSMLIPISEFKSRGVTIFFMINGSTPEYANFTYASDTSIKISTDYEHELAFRVWGVKTP